MNDALMHRFSRQLVLPEIDFLGQNELQKARVGIVGVGGLGAPAALYLAGAGIGFLRLFDHDVIDVSNLHRQISFRSEDVGQSKAEIAARECKKINPESKIEFIQKKMTEELMAAHFHDLDVIIDATDNFKSRFALNRACIQLKKPLVMGSAIQWAGQWTVYQGHLNNAPCYACVFPEEADEARASCSEVGIVGPVAGMVANMIALLTLQHLLKINLPHQLHHFDAKNHDCKKIDLIKDPACETCSAR